MHVMREDVMFCHDMGFDVQKGGQWAFKHYPERINLFVLLLRCL